ncbi:hypothetical protein ACVGXB_20480, partial [Enterobacter intestinihominis]
GLAGDIREDRPQTVTPLGAFAIIRCPNKWTGFVCDGFVIIGKIRGTADGILYNWCEGGDFNRHVGKDTNT